MSQQTSNGPRADADSVLAEADQERSPGADSGERAETVAVETSELDELNARLQQAEARAEENWNLYLTAKAETENVRKRSERDIANARKFGLEKLLGELLPVKDSIELGISAAEETTDVEKLKEGNELTLKMLSAVLHKFGVQTIHPACGEKFDPELHEAMAMQPDDKAEPNTILQVIQKGYSLNDRLIRPAMVIVARGSA